MVDTPGPLHPAEEASLSPRAVPKRRLDFALGRTAARQALGLDVTIHRDAHRAPIWPEGTRGAITHAAGLAIAAVAPALRTSGLGVDLEDVGRLEDVAIARQVADAEERRWIDDDPRRLGLLFSAKEATYKALYPLRPGWIGFDAVTLRWRDEGFDARLTERIDAEHPVGFCFRIEVQRAGALALTSVLLT